MVNIFYTHMIAYSASKNWFVHNSGALWFSWFKFDIIEIIENHRFQYRKIVAKFKSQYYINQAIGIMKNPVWKIFSLFANFTWRFPPKSKTALNPISRHYYWKYRSADIESRFIVTHHIEMTISKMSNLQTISKRKVSSSISNQH